MVLRSCELRIHFIFIYIDRIASFMGGLLYSSVHSQISKGLVRWRFCEQEMAGTRFSHVGSVRHSIRFFVQ